MRVDRLAFEIVAALAAGRWTRADIRVRIRRVVGQAARGPTDRLSRDLAANADRLRYRSPTKLAKSLKIWRQFQTIKKTLAQRGARPAIVLESPIFQPIGPFADCVVPQLLTTEDLRAWLAVSDTELEWFADSRRTNAAAASNTLLHYRYRWIPRSSGRYRLLEAPKDRLKAIQRRILAEILDQIPCHEAAHGFRAGRSILTAAACHAGEDVVVAIDLQEFFPSTNLGRVYALFRRIGYPHAVARCLTDLCSTTTPRWVFSSHPADRDLIRKSEWLYRRPHLPQGAPTSPALANLVGFRLDCRLSRLAASLDARYTRYADDLVFSGDREFLRGLGATTKLIARIATEEGCAVHPAKTRIMRRSGRQSVLGLTINEHLNIRREHFDALKAVLHNCRTLGPASQNRDGHADFRLHLSGRVAWAEQVNPVKGARLRAIFEAIRW